MEPSDEDLVTLFWTTRERIRAEQRPSYDAQSILIGDDYDAQEVAMNEWDAQTFRAAKAELKSEMPHALYERMCKAQGDLRARTQRRRANGVPTKSLVNLRRR